MHRPAGGAVGVLPAALLLAACASMQDGREVPASLTNRLGMAMVLLPAGEFTMGREATVADMAARYPAYEPRRVQELGDEQPAHRVRIVRPFYMARHEVTVGQFRRFLQASGHVPESVADGTGGYGHDPRYAPGPGADAFKGRDPRYSWSDPGFPQSDEHPVVNVTWNDAQALAGWLSAVEGRRYRLPTEAEWEYACRAGAGGTDDGGGDPPALASAANVFDIDSAAHWPQWQAFALPVRDGYAFTAPVGRFAPNAFGLHDLLGNAWEWTADWYDEAAYATSPRDDPRGPTDGQVKVRRGGSWNTWPLYARCTYRNWNSQSTRYVLVGIRLVMDAD